MLSIVLMGRDQRPLHHPSNVLPMELIKCHIPVIHIFSGLVLPLSLVAVIEHCLIFEINSAHGDAFFLCVDGILDPDYYYFVCSDCLHFDALSER